MKFNLHLVFCLAAACLTAAAQEVPFYEELLQARIIPARSEDAIRNEMRDVQKAQEQSGQPIAAAQKRVQEADGWLAKLKTQSDDVKNKLNLAKKEKRESDKVTLEAQQKQLNLVDDYLKKMKSVREAELDVATTHKGVLDAQVKALQGEMDLAKKTEAVKAAGAKAPNIATLATAAMKSADTALQAMKASSDKSQDYAGKMKQLNDKRLDLAQSRSKLATEDRIRAAVAKMQ